MHSNLALKLINVSKEYRIGTKKDGSLRGTLASLFSKQNQSKECFWALKDVSFEVEKGDVIGIIGRNGAGKSTLLKILSQITRPTEGKIEVNGRIASLLEVGTGFHPELTGRENVFLNGTILGMTRKEVASKFDEIVTFSGIEKFIDTPVKHYSSGMYVRLAFAVAAHLEPEILIIDEVLAVGDAEFQKKCLGKMKDVAGEGRTVLFVSHDLGAVESLCNKAVLLENGKVKTLGNTSDVLNAYILNNRQHEIDLSVIEARKGNAAIKFVDAYWKGYGSSTKNVLKTLDECVLVVQLDKVVDLEKTRIDIGINDIKEKRVAWLSTIVSNKEKTPTDKVEFHIRNFNLTPGNYTCNLFCETNKELNDWLQFVLPFEVIKTDYYETGRMIPDNQGILVLKYDIL